MKRTPPKTHALGPRLKRWCGAGPSTPLREGTQAPTCRVCRKRMEAAIVRAQMVALVPEGEPRH